MILKRFLTITVLVLISSVSTMAVGYTLSKFKKDDGFQWRYDSWEAQEALDEKGSYQVIQPPATERGGGGRTLTKDLSKYADHYIEIECRLGKDNEADRFKVVIQDWDGTAGAWSFDTQDIPVTPKGFVTLRSKTPMSSPELQHREGDTPGMDFSNIDSWQVIGDYSHPIKFDIQFKTLKLVP